ncbi:uncharacterized protein SPPG_05515 [Spizellomyces punctatus DAOM BR117]|uniref:Uncharacterized protein n=1 Tax=Spizellomyces punctatus (strain DAOM BR117) TaxID=645134 RepID=A0A0L0HCJ4_SPIPD|nr:uncharacterized protein SPPG_05515 [Spizellomyces punctatus DAOM BR117]KNC99260.1 hypothetical protein SPPG_05515 [Spizellomyces punctatus DAOM BR117]|eukprot:XP_016607300.1 hypothetical protein SPPG_05515 [Spizellomyces punctatus DAOM BR117]
MFIFDAWSRHRELKRLSKYANRRQTASSPKSSTVGTITLPRIPKASYDWDSPDTKARHAAEYHFEVEKTIREQRQRAQIMQENYKRPKEGVLVVLATDEGQQGTTGRICAEPEQYATTGRRPVSQYPARYASMDAKRPNLQQQITRSKTIQETKRKSSWWGKRKMVDPRTVRSSEEYNSLEHVPTTRMTV